METRLGAAIVLDKLNANMNKQKKARGTIYPATGITCREFRSSTRGSLSATIPTPPDALRYRISLRRLEFIDK